MRWGASPGTSHSWPKTKSRGPRPPEGGRKELNPLPEAARGSFNDWALPPPALQARRLFDVFHEPFLRVPR